MTRKSGLILLSILCLAMITVAALMPATHNLVRLLFIEDACWTISWLIFAWTSFKLKKAEYPVSAMPITLAVEIYLCYHFTIRTSWPFDSWMIINYILWPLASCLNLYATYLYGRDEFVPGGKRSNFFLRLIPETGIYFLIFWFLGSKIPQNVVMVFFGQTVICLISLHFMVRVFADENPEARSLTGNFFRMAGGILCYYANSVIWKDEHGSLMYLRILIPLVIMMDFATIARICVSRWKKKN